MVSQNSKHQAKQPPSNPSEDFGANCSSLTWRCICGCNYGYIKQEMLFYKNVQNHYNINENHNLKALVNVVHLCQPDFKK